MSLQKNVTSARTGAVLAFHEAQQVSFREGFADVVVASYVDAAAKQAGKAFAELSAESFPHDGSAINQAPKAFAEGLLLTLEKFQGATQV